MFSVFDISTNPAKQLAHIWVDGFDKDIDNDNGKPEVAISSKHGILVGAHYDDVGSMFESGVFIFFTQHKGRFIQGWNLKSNNLM